jgi:hypothetical protein
VLIKIEIGIPFLLHRRAAEDAKAAQSLWVVSATYGYLNLKVMDIITPLSGT